MRRRRLVVVVGAAALLTAAAAWWLLSATALSPQERRLVGAWRLRSPTTVRPGVWVLTADRRWRSVADPPPAGTGAEHLGHWRCDDGTLVLDSDPSAVRRVARRFASYAGLATPHTAEFAVESVSDDELVLTAAGETYRFTRDP